MATRHLIEPDRPGIIAEAVAAAVAHGLVDAGEVQAAIDTALSEPAPVAREGSGASAIVRQGAMDDAIDTAATRDGVAFGRTTDLAGTLGVDYAVDGWGVSDAGVPYWDPEGPDEGDEGIFAVDPFGVPYWRRIADIRLANVPDRDDLSYLRRSAGNGERVAEVDSFASVRRNLNQLGNTPGTIIIPPGLYEIDNPDDFKLTLHDKRLVGFGAETTVFKLADGVNPVEVAVLDAVGVERLSLEHLGFDANRDGNPTSGTRGVRLTDCYDVTAAHVLVRNTRRAPDTTTGSGFLIYGGSQFDLARVVADNCAYHGISMTSNPLLVTMDRCIGRHCTLEGIHTSTGEVMMTACWAHDNGSNGFGTQNAVRSTYTGCVAFDNGLDGFNASGGSKTFAGCIAYQNGHNGFGWVATGGGLGRLTAVGCLAHHNTRRGFYARQLAAGVAFTGLVARDNGADYPAFEIDTAPTSGTPGVAVTGGALLGGTESLKIAGYDLSHLAIRGVHTPQGIVLDGSPFHESDNVPYSGDVPGATTVAQALNILAQ